MHTLLRLRFTHLVTALAISLGAVVGLGTPSQAAALTNNVVFNNPNDATSEYAIENYLIGLINGTPAGETIRMSFYAFNSQDYYDALVAAYNRGVNVKIVADDYAPSSNVQKTTTDLAAVLGTDAAAKSYVLLCNGGCIEHNPSGGIINHNKFYLFTNTSGSSNVVVQSSANMISVTSGVNGGINAWNNALTVVDQPDIYQSYIDRFTAMKAGQMSGTASSVDYTTATGTNTTTGTSAKSYFFPQQDTSKDVVLDILNNIDCSTNGSVHLAMYDIKDTAVAQKLKSLDDAGCTVHVAYTDQGTSDDTTVNALSACGPHNGVAIYKFDKTAPPAAMLHSKYLVVNADYLGTEQQIIWTGSLNYTTQSLHANDEALLKYSGTPEIYTSYESNFTALEGLGAYSRAGTC
ncbi:phospholipase D-like domain-containing protein [Streptomyces sp. NBC_01171]|uniref:phospholipase D-like domain-containing protein n=1 Tax=Streptomyces sp. NBC_01171 TaxID=2903757 RepID=UPI00386755D2|nr:phospholipase D-like domain-containing protein [Streptomyces sp. NBC_01171]